MKECIFLECIRLIEAAGGGTDHFMKAAAGPICGSAQACAGAGRRARLLLYAGGWVSGWLLQGGGTCWTHLQTEPAHRGLTEVPGQPRSRTRELAGAGRRTLYSSAQWECQNQHSKALFCAGIVANADNWYSCSRVISSVSMSPGVMGDGTASTKDSHPF